jgi:hypothetical protein
MSALSSSIFSFSQLFLPYLYFSGHTNPLRSHERRVATAENLVSRERSQGRSGGFGRTVHRRPLTPRTAHHHGNGRSASFVLIGDSVSALHCSPI